MTSSTLAKVHQANLDSFLAIAEELKLKGLEKDDQPLNPKPPEKTEESTIGFSLAQNENDVALAISADLEALDEKVRSMMERSQNLIQAGTRANGKPKQEKALKCKVCGKEDRFTQIRNHIEANHLEGISISCNHCYKTFSSSASLGRHKRTFHK